MEEQYSVFVAHKKVDGKHHFHVSPALSIAIGEHEALLVDGGWTVLDRSHEHTIKTAIMMCNQCNHVHCEEHYADKI